MVAPSGKLISSGPKIGQLACASLFGKSERVFLTAPTLRQGSHKRAYLPVTLEN